jgi:hypothetical protein
MRAPAPRLDEVSRPQGLKIFSAGAAFGLTPAEVFFVVRSLTVLRQRPP